MRTQQGRFVIAAALAVAAFLGPTSEARGLQPASPEVLQRIAARLESTVLAYWVTDGATAVTVADRDGNITSKSIDVPRARLEQLVRLPEAEAYRALYDLLIAPVRGLLPGRDSLLTIVPDGPLVNLSFAPLANENGRYLIEDFRLHYLPIAFAAGRAPEPANRRDSFLLVANTPAATREVNAVVRSMRLVNPTMLVGKDANTNRIRAAIANARVAHLAMQGLTPALISGVKLSADLAVISACCTGSAGSGDEASTLSTALLSAGARTLLMPLWDTREEVWQPLVAGFYEAWQKGGDKTIALRTAQLALLRDLRSGRLKVNAPSGDETLLPKAQFWANAILIGEP